MKSVIFHRLSGMLWVLLILTAGASQLLAANNKYGGDKAVSQVVRDLSARLKTELVQENISLSLKNVEKKSLSQNELFLTGTAFCVLKEENTRLPISFEAKFNVSKEAVDEIRYVFLEADYAPVYEEDFLMQHLLNRIRQDQKTENVVIAIDGFEARETAAKAKEFKGWAEVRIGDVEWKKIDFDVTLSSDNNPLKIVYNVIN